MCGLRCEDYDAADRDLVTEFGENIVVFINPFSGTKKAVKVWEKVEPLFLINDAKLTVITTRAAGHCKQESETMDLRQVDRLVRVCYFFVLSELNSFDSYRGHNRLRYLAMAY
jgi:hypothetical protein